MTQPTLKTSNGAVSTAISSSIASPAATTEVLPKAKRRTFSVAYKQQILHAADACPSGHLGALLRREGLHSSHLTRWRRQRDQGELASRKRGKKADSQAPTAKGAVAGETNSG